MSIPVIHTLKPAYTIIERLGGKTAVASELQVDKSTLSRWCQPKPVGTGGAIPLRHWQQLIDMARTRDVVITLEELAAVEV